MRRLWFLGVTLAALAGLATEQKFNFSTNAIDQLPRGFRGTTATPGAPGDWKVIVEDSGRAPGASGSSHTQTGREKVLAQSSRNGGRNRFPMLIFEDAVYGDFKLSTRFKIAGGALAQSAGVVFRFLNESNFYVLRANALEGTFQCFKVANGEWKTPIGPSVGVSAGAWHELSIECLGTRLVGSLDGTNAVRLIDASGNQAGKIGFWTELDTAAYFTDATIAFEEKERLAQKLVRDALETYPRLLGLTVYAIPAGSRRPEVVASKDPADMGKPGGESEQDVISRGTRYISKSQGSVSVTVPLHDRNGDPIAAVCVRLKTFPGQTEDNAVARMRPVVQRMQKQVQSLDDLVR
jgi:hypothetical protein